VSEPYTTIEALLILGMVCCAVLLAINGIGIRRRP
jgi:hypothetical protein